MDIGKAIGFIFNDPDWWKKLLIGTLILLIPIIGLIVLKGWWIEVIKRVANDDPEPLPSFEKFGDLLSSGFRSLLVYLVYKSPIIILSVILMVAFFVPFIVLDGDPSDDLTGFLGLYLVCGGLFLLPLSLALSFFERSAQMELAAEGKLTEALNFKKVFGVFKLTWPQILLAMIIAFIASLVIQPVAGVIILFGTLLVSVFLAAFTGHLYGQVYQTVIRSNPAGSSTSIPPEDPGVVTM